MAFSEGTSGVRDSMQISFCATERQPPWSRNSLRYKLKYLENQENYFSQKGLMCRVFKNLSYEISLYQRPCSSLMLPCIAFNFLRHDFIYEAERSAWPSYDKNETDNIINAPKNDK